jgi:hypothetical protein
MAFLTCNPLSVASGYLNVKCHRPVLSALWRPTSLVIFSDLSNLMYFLYMCKYGTLKPIEVILRRMVGEEREK